MDTYDPVEAHTGRHTYFAVNVDDDPARRAKLKMVHALALAVIEECDRLQGPFATPADQSEAEHKIYSVNQGLLEILGTKFSYSLKYIEDHGDSILTIARDYRGPVRGKSS